jgi:AcrR family transcriptional regulator
VSSADLLLHPVRLRIVKTFLGDRSLTTAQIAAELDDVPTGSLYRHIAILSKAGVLHVVSERKVRGTLEKTYRLRMLAAQMQPDEVQAMSIDDHTQAFMAYVAGLLGDFDRYLNHEAAPGRDDADYRVNAMWLTDTEYADFLRDFREVLLARLANKATQERRRRVIYHVLLPAPEDPRSTADLT